MRARFLLEFRREALGLRAMPPPDTPRKRDNRARPHLQQEGMEYAPRVSLRNMAERERFNRTILEIYE
jgi:hypothetical protein